MKQCLLKGNKKDGGNSGKSKVSKNGDKKTGHKTEVN